MTVMQVRKTNILTLEKSEKFVTKLQLSFLYEL